MLARITSKLMVIALVGTAWLGSHAGCDGGGMYANFGGVYNAFGGMYDTVGDYFWGGDSYYEDSFWGDDYAYEPYLGEYYDAGYGEAVVW